MTLIPAIINLFTPIVTYLIPPQLPPMLPPQPIIKEHVYVASSELEPERNSFYALTSWYGPGFHGNQTANGEIYNQNDMTAAHPNLPFGTELQITYRGNTVIVRVNDRGPYAGNRSLDISSAAADAIGLKDAGVDEVRVTIL